MFPSADAQRLTSRFGQPTWGRQPGLNAFRQPRPQAVAPAGSFRVSANDAASVLKMTHGGRGISNYLAQKGQRKSGAAPARPDRHKFVPRPRPVSAAGGPLSTPTLRRELLTGSATSLPSSGSGSGRTTKISIKGVHKNRSELHRPAPKKWPLKVAASQSAPTPALSSAARSDRPLASDDSETSSDEGVVMRPRRRSGDLVMLGRIDRDPLADKADTPPESPARAAPVDHSCSTQQSRARLSEPRSFDDGRDRSGSDPHISSQCNGPADANYIPPWRVQV